MHVGRLAVRVGRFVEMLFSAYPSLPCRALQVAGITQNSFVPDAAFLRYCAQRFPSSAGQLILSLAKVRPH